MRAKPTLLVPTRPADLSRQMRGSSTLRRTQSVKNAGRIADEEHAAPSPAWQHEHGDHGGRAVAYGPCTLHERRAPCRGLRRPRFGHQRGTTCPLTAEANPEHDAEDRELRHGLREAAGRGEHRVDQHAGHERTRAAEPIGHDTEDHPANG